MDKELSRFTRLLGEWDQAYQALLAQPNCEPLEHCYEQCRNELYRYVESLCRPKDITGLE